MQKGYLGARCTQSQEPSKPLCLLLSLCCHVGCTQDFDNTESQPLCFVFSVKFSVHFHWASVVFRLHRHAGIKTGFPHTVVIPPQMCMLHALQKNNFLKYKAAPSSLHASLKTMNRGPKVEARILNAFTSLKPPFQATNCSLKKLAKFYFNLCCVLFRHWNSWQSNLCMCMGMHVYVYVCVVCACKGGRSGRVLFPNFKWKPIEQLWFPLNLHNIAHNDRSLNCIVLDGSNCSFQTIWSLVCGLDHALFFWPWLIISA